MNPHAKQLKALLERQQHHTHRLAAALKEEQTALTAGSVAAIEAATAGKHVCLQQLEEDAQSQATLLAQARLPSDEAGMNAYLHRCDPAGELQLEAQWRKVKDALARCREHNLINGRILTLQQRQTQQALAILRGGGAQSEECYSAKGRGAKGITSRSLGRV